MNRSRVGAFLYWLVGMRKTLPKVYRLEDCQQFDPELDEQQLARLQEAGCLEFNENDWTATEKGRQLGISWFHQQGNPDESWRESSLGSVMASSFLSWVLSADGTSPIVASQYPPWENTISFEIVQLLIDRQLMQRSGVKDNLLEDLIYVTEKGRKFIVQQLDNRRQQCSSSEIKLPDNG